MANKILNDAWDVRGLLPTEKCVLVRLADFADKEGHCFPSHERIACDCGMSERSVRAILPRLEAAKHITTKREHGRSFKGRSKFSYIIHPLTPEAASAVTPEGNAATPEAGAPDTGKSRHSTPENPASPNIEPPWVNHQVNPHGTKERYLPPLLAQGEGGNK